MSIIGGANVPRANASRSVTQSALGKLGTYSLSPKNVDGSPKTETPHPLNVHVVVLLHIHVKVVSDVHVYVHVVVVVETLNFSVKNTVFRSEKFLSSSSTLLTSFSTYLSIIPSMITSTLLTA